jgi:hypothetical protein
MKLLGDVGHVKSHFGLFGVGVSAVYDRCIVFTKHRNHFGHTRRFSLVTRLKWKLVSVCMEIVLILTQDWNAVCAKRTIGLEIILDIPSGTPR